MTVQDFLDALQEIESLAITGAETVKALDPALTAPIAGFEVVLPIVSKLVSVALSAYSSANDQPITPETIQALLPNQTPLTPPDAA